MPGAACDVGHSWRTFWQILAAQLVPDGPPLSLLFPFAVAVLFIGISIGMLAIVLAVAAACYHCTRRPLPTPAPPAAPAGEEPAPAKGERGCMHRSAGPVLGSAHPLPLLDCCLSSLTLLSLPHSPSLINR